MHHFSIRVPVPLFEELKQHARVNRKNISDLAREYLSTGMKASSHPDLGPTFNEESHEMQKRLTVFTLFTHCLIEQFIKSTVPNSAQICSLAETKAKEMATAMLKKDQGSD